MAVMSRRVVLQLLAAQALGAGAASGQARVHRKPKPLRAGAVSHDWPSFLGPSHNAVSTETKLSRVLPPPLVWEFPKGTGYASPAIAGDRLVFLHRLGERGDRRVPAPGDGREPLAVSLRDRVRGSVRLQQRPAVEPGHRWRPRVHRRRRGQAALPGPCNRARWCGSGTCERSTRCRRTSSARPRRRSWKASC